MTNIKFGTDGWRAIIAEEYTVENVIRVSEAVAKWILNTKKKNPKIVVGYDCRFGGKMFAEVVSKVLLKRNISVVLSNTYIPTPIVSFSANKMKCNLGVMITASHNPPSYNGYKLKSQLGGSLDIESIKQIEKMIPSEVDSLQAYGKLPNSEKNSKFVVKNLITPYLKHVKEVLNIKKINKSGINIIFDAMYGSGKDVFSKLIPKATILHQDTNPSFNGVNPEPTEKNLSELKKTMKNGKFDLGIAVDGDADRVALFDQNGNYVDSHHILLLSIYYLHKFKGLTGKVCTTISASNKISEMAKKYGLELEITPIGFKYIAAIMEKEDVLIGGEESGGIGVKGHIIERDGIFMGLLIAEMMIETKKPVTELIQDLYKEIGTFGVARDDIHLEQKQKQKIITDCENRTFDQLGERKIAKVNHLDGFKFIFEDNSWVMIRPSGTEPVLRIYSEAENPETARKIIAETKEKLLS